MTPSLPMALPRAVVATNPPVRRATCVQVQSHVSGVSLSACFTLALWIGCLSVGWVGLTIPYSRPPVPAKQPEPITAEVLNVELAADPLPPPAAAPPPPRFDPASPPPLLDPIVISPTPPLIAVAKPSPAIAFALPVEAPARIVEVRHAASARPAEPIAARSSPAAQSGPVASGGSAPSGTVRPAVQALTFGRGEGKQPAPEYPRRAVREGQEGTVVIRFSVGEAGRVLAAEAVSPSPWLSLNEAALRVVRQRWRFPAGLVRVYQVAIRFELQK